MITDFAAGDNGDSLDLSNVTNYYLDGWTQGTNPFTSGYLRVVADGADTLLQMDRDGNGTGYGWLSLVRLQGVAPSSLTVANFSNGYAPNDVGITAPARAPMSGSTAATPATHCRAEPATTRCTATTVPTA
ncbi:type I secretion C-terminal target domain-containing protein [Methylobacterium aquaticum]|uniref:type I secretion C-terminal target domain-containing protein n=1 Tax=Methylobacterium aquaticum TaxID=270351 RepID=UPI0019324000|nr:type I secretion C-terminal target domain-containing protein [Methylobacterium aquaticum]